MTTNQKPAQGSDDELEGGTFDDGLSDKQRAFVQEYLIDLNASQAAIRAGYSPNGAGLAGHRLLKNEKVKGAIDDAKAARAEACEITASRVLEELAVIAFADLGEAISIDAHGRVNVRPLDAMPGRVRRSISEITQQTSEIHRGDSEPTVEKVKLGIKQHSKVAALKMLMEHLGMAAPVKSEVKTDVGSLGLAELLKLIEKTQ